ncbi:MAG: DUF642 domain-containing protein [Actinomycetia bacterium]|nr:DUF642 domain-containing protein [Actinomycetes bacterium]
MSRIRRLGGDGGGVLLATVAIMVVTLSGVALLRLHTNELTLVTADQSRTQAELLAELAAAEGLSRIEYAPDPILGGKGEVDGNPFQYEGNRDGDGTWVVHAEATVDGITKAVEVTRTTTTSGSGGSARPFSLFIHRKGKIKKNPLTIEGVVGTAGELEIESATIGSRQELYQPDGKCEKCPNPVTMGVTPPLIDPVAPVGGRTCPTGNFFWEVTDGQNGKPFSCSGGFVVLYGGLSVVNPPLIISAPAGQQIYLIEADVNLGGYAEDVQIIQPGGGTISSWRSAFYGVFDTPDTRWNRSSDVSIVGSLIINRINQDGDGLGVAPGLMAPAGTTLGPITDWRAVPPIDGFTATVTVDGEPAPVSGGDVVEAPRNLIADGGFETDPASLDFDSSGTGVWTFGSGDSLGGGWTVTSGDIDVLTGDAGIGVLQGDHVVDLAGTQQGEISQTVSTEPGKLYELTLLLAENTGCGSKKKEMDVLWGGSVVGSIQIDLPSSSSTTRSLSLPAPTSSTTTLSLRGTSGQQACGVIVDAVDLREIV